MKDKALKQSAEKLSTLQAAWMVSHIRTFIERMHNVAASTSVIDMVGSITELGAKVISLSNCMEFLPDGRVVVLFPEFNNVKEDSEVMKTVQAELRDYNISIYNDRTQYLVDPAFDQSLPVFHIVIDTRVFVEHEGE